MYTTMNSLKVLVSPLTSPSVAPNVTDLAEGEMGYFNKTTGALILAGSGEGYFALRKNGSVIKSKVLTGLAGYATDLEDYAAPVLHTVTITIPTVVIGTTYMVQLEVKIPGMRGEFYFHAPYLAQTGDDATAVATAITLALNNTLVREQKADYFTVTSATDTITITNKLRAYVQGHLPGRPANFKARLTLPEDEALLATVTVAGSDGVGYAPYVAELEYLAQGDSDPNRLIDWRNNFNWIGNAIVGGEYDVMVLKDDNRVDTANSRVKAPMEYIVAFNTVGVTPIPYIDASEDSDTSVTGTAVPGSTVTLYVDTVAQTPVVAHATTGVWTDPHDAATGEVLTATALVTGGVVSALSDAVTVIA